MTSGGNSFTDFPEDGARVIFTVRHQKNYFPQLFPESILLPPVNGVDVPAFVPRHLPPIWFLPARRYAIARLRAMALCLSVCLFVCLSQVRVLSKRENESCWFWARPGASFDHPMLSCKKIRVSPKITALPSGTLSDTPDLENFATAYRSSKCVINLARQKWM